MWYAPIHQKYPLRTPAQRWVFWVTHSFSCIGVRTHVNTPLQGTQEMTNSPSKRRTKAVKDLVISQGGANVIPGSGSHLDDPVLHHTSIKLAPPENLVSQHLKQLPEDSEVPIFFLFLFISGHVSQPSHGKSLSWPLPVFVLFSSFAGTPFNLLSSVRI